MRKGKTNRRRDSMFDTCFCSSQAFNFFSFFFSRLFFCCPQKTCSDEVTNIRFGRKRSCVSGFAVLVSIYTA